MKGLEERRREEKRRGLVAREELEEDDVYLEMSYTWIISDVPDLTWQVVVSKNKL